jgi:tRNA A-37 threonylcarbamoyl transferase component Bud32
MIGETFGSYRVTSKIGEGGMGAVYLAEHTLIGRKVAIKVLLPEHSRKQDLVDRFFNEARTAAGLNHPALVDVFDFGIHPGGSAYLVMDYLEGESLGSRLARVAPLDAEVAVDLARQIARGMEVAHGQGIVHRDLKPDNIFLVADADDASRDQVKILDFGIAKLLGAPSGSKGATSTGMVLGTPWFMAPEQCRGTGPVDHRADIYSLGCILYLMLCARPPFDHAGVGEILGAHLHEPVTPPRAINPAVPPALEAVVMKALAKNPEERYQTMAALGADLARMGAPTGALVPIAAPPPARVVPTAPGVTTLSKAASAVATPAPARRRRLLAPVAAITAAGLAALGVAILLQLRPASGPARSALLPAASDGPRHRAATPAPATPASWSPATGADPDASLSRPASGPPPADAAAPSRAAAAPSRRERWAEPRREPVDAYARAVTHLARGDEREALEWFRTYLRGSGLPPARRAEAEGYSIALGRKFAEVEIDCELPGADVSLDGRPVGRSPLKKGLLVVPGLHEVVVTREGYQPLRKAIRVAGGERLPIFFRFPR